MEVTVLSEVGSKTEEQGFENKRNKRRQKARRPLKNLNQNQGNGNVKSLKEREQGWKKQEGKRMDQSFEHKRNRKKRRVSES